MQVQEKIRMVDGGISYKTYTKIKGIGSGSFSKVWLVGVSGSDKTYALKIISKKQMKVLENERVVWCRFSSSSKSKCINPWCTRM